MSKTDRRDRGALVALWLALTAIVFVAWLSQPSGGSVAHPDTNQIENAQQDDVARLVAAIREFDPWDDTYAQWLMAAFTVVAAGISLAAVVLVNRSLELNRKATEAAVMAADAARDAIGAERAWLTSAGVRNEFHSDVVTPDGVVHDQGIAFATNWVNSGRSPAQKTSVYGDGCVIGIDDPIPRFDPKPHIGDKASAVIGPGMVGHSAPFLVVGPDLQALLSREKRVIIYSQVTYADSFQPEVLRNSESCISLSYRGKQQGRDGTVGDIFDTIPMGSQNTAT
jgi:hypothetical protein